MNQLQYISRVLRGASFKKLFAVIDRIHEKSGQNKLYTLLDIINCSIRYGAGYYDYLIFAFWAMNHRQRNTYLTRMRNKRLNALLHDHGEYIIGRMGIPYRKRKVSIISIALDAPQNTISALSGKIGALPGVSVKTAYSGVISND